VPPQSDANNNWAVNPINPTGNVVLPQSQYANNKFWNNVPAIQYPTFVTPPLTTNPAWVPPTGTGGGTNPPTTNPPTGGGGGGSGGGSGTGTGGQQPPRNNTDPIWFDRNGTNYVAPGTVFDNSGKVRTDTGNGNSFMNYLDNIKGTLTDNQGNFDWRQAIDMASELFGIHGDLYMSETGVWNQQNIVKAIADKVLPGLGGAIFEGLKALSLNLAPGSKLATWFFNGSLTQVMNTLARDMRQNNGKLTKEAIKKALEQEDPNLVKEIVVPEPVVRNGGGGCVCTYVKLQDYDRADEVAVGDTMIVSDPVTGEHSTGEVSFSETKLVPCVRITTARGVELDCSMTAPIADVEGNQILAPNLFDKVIPVVIDDEFSWDRVVKIETLGDQYVQHITVENNFFLAGNHEGKYVFHHNVKMVEGSGRNFWGGGGSGGVGPLWGSGGPWGEGSGTVTVGGPVQL
jgi:hypothetical protein